MTHLAKPLLSVLIPTINRVESVIRAVNSVGVHEDVEIVIVDDGSEDNCYKELESKLAGIENVILFSNSSNLGLVRNWNKCIRLAKGEWLSLLCSDDYFLPGGLCRLRGIIEGMDPCLVIQAPYISEERLRLKAGQDSVRLLHLPFVSGTTWNARISRELGGFDEELKYSPDAEYWFRMAARYDTLQIRDAFAVYTSHEGNYMWETWRKPDFIEQIRLVASKNAAHFIDFDKATAIRAFQAAAVRDTILTMMGESAGSRRHRLFFHAFHLALENRIAPGLLIRAVVNYFFEILWLRKIKSTIGRVARSLIR